MQSSTRPKLHCLRCFTLIELLVVIAIIAVLASMLLPALSRARAVAQQTDSMSNVKQLTLSVISYADDSDDVFPFINFSNKGIPGEDTDPKHQAWCLRLLEWGYVPDKSLYWSAARINDPDNGNWHKHPGYGLSEAVSVTYEDFKKKGDPPPLKNGGDYPADNMVMLAETWSGVWAPSGSTYAGLYWVRPGEIGKDDGPFGDGGALNFKLFTYNGKNVQGYVDGHAMAMNARDAGYDPGAGGQDGWWIYTSGSLFTKKGPWQLGWR